MERLKALAGRWGWTKTLFAVHERVGETNGGATASAATVMFFVSIFPLILVAISVLGFVSANNDDLAADIVDRLGVEGTAAETVENAVATAQNSRRAASIIGIIGLLWSGLGVTAAVSLAVRTPWQRKVEGVRSKGLGFVWLVGAALTFVGSIASGAVIAWLPDSVPREVTSVGLVLLGLGFELAFFLWTFWILGDRRAGWRALVPGAIVGAVGFEILTKVGTVLVPRMVASSSALYGPLGVVFAILAWLAFFSRLVVYASALNAQLFEEKHGTVTLEIKALRFDGEIPLEADRGGAVVAPEPAPADT